MTHDEIMAAARRVGDKYKRGEPTNESIIFAKELIRLHDGAAWSSEPPTEPGWYWWKDEVYEPSVRWFDGDHSMLGGGFWLRAEPADAAVVAELRAEVELLKTQVQDEMYLRGNQLAAISTVLMANTPITLLETRLPKDHALYTAAFQDAVATIEREIKLRSDRDRLSAELAEAQRRLADAERAFDRRLAEVTAERDGLANENKAWAEEYDRKNMADGSWGK